MFVSLDKKMLSETWLHQMSDAPSDHRFLKIHAGIWLGWMEYRGMRLEFRLHFNQLEVLEVWTEGRCASLDVFLGLTLDDHAIETRLNSLAGDDLLGQDLHYWRGCLQQLRRLKSSYR